MRSKTLSAPLIRKNMTRHWLLLFAVSIYFLTFVFEKIHGLALIKEMTIAIYGDIALQKFQGSWQDEMFSGTLGILELLFSTLAALCAFSYLHKKKEEHFYRSLPTKTADLFRSSLLSGVLFYGIPWLVTTVLAAPILYFMGDCKGFILWTYLAGMIFRLGLYLIAYSVAVLGSVLSGRRFFALILTYLLHIQFPMLEEVCYLILENNLLGISSKPTYFSDMFSPFTAVMHCLDTRVYGENKAIVWGTLGFYLGVALLLMWLTGFLHRKRKAEDAGQNLVFSSLLVWFQTLLTLLLSYTIASILADAELILSYDRPLAFPCLLLSPIAFFLGRMLLLRSRKVFQKKAFLQCGIIATCFLLLILVFQYDLLYIVRRVPNPNSVKELTVTVNGMPFTTDNPLDIRDFTEIHKQIVDAGEAQSHDEAENAFYFVLPYDIILGDTPSYYSLWYRVDITYDLGSRTIERSYNLQPTEPEIIDIWVALDKYFREGTRAKRQIIALSENIDHITISQPLWESKPDTLDGPRYTLSTTQMNTLCWALLKDAGKQGTSLMIPYGDLYGVEIQFKLKSGEYIRTYLHYWEHENARNVIDAILETYKTTP